MRWRRNRLVVLGALMALGASLVACDGDSSPASDEATSQSGDERSVGDEADGENGGNGGDGGNGGEGGSGAADGAGSAEGDADGGDEPAESASTSGDDEPPPLHPEVDDWPATTVEVTSGGTTHEVAARVASTPDRRRRGLQHVEEVPEGAGMLFLFEEEQDSGFWMKDTLVPLDIAFVDAEGRVVQVLTMEPCRSSPCPTYEPGGEYRAALEVPADWLVERGVSTGDRIAWDEATAGR